MMDERWIGRDNKIRELEAEAKELKHDREEDLKAEQHLGKLVLSGYIDQIETGGEPQYSISLTGLRILHEVYARGDRFRAMSRTAIGSRYEGSGI